MARLLVSVRSAEEAHLALAGGAAIIDVKEPHHGPLGRASFDVWEEVRHVIPAGVKSSVALGELSEWLGENPPEIPPHILDHYTYAKVGLAGAGPDWAEQVEALAGKLPARRIKWVAVAYTDWEAAGAPSPTTMLDAYLRYDAVLFDTWDKSRPAEWTRELLLAAEEFREGDTPLAVAGGLTAERLDEIAVLEPDIVAVRGAACEGGDRNRTIDPARVASLVKLAARLPSGRRR